MDIPLSAFLVAYALIVMAVAVVGGLNVYTALKHGMKTLATTVMSVVFIFGMVVIIFSTAVVVSGADWTTVVSIGTPEISVPGLTP